MLSFRCERQGDDEVLVALECLELRIVAAVPEPDGPVCPGGGNELPDARIGDRLDGVLVPLEQVGGRRQTLLVPQGNRPIVAADEYAILATGECDGPDARRAALQRLELGAVVRAPDLHRAVLVSRDDGAIEDGERARLCRIRLQGAHCVALEVEDLQRAVLARRDDVATIGSEGDLRHRRIMGADDRREASRFGYRRCQEPVGALALGASFGVRRARGLRGGRRLEPALIDDEGDSQHEAEHELAGERPHLAPEPRALRLRRRGPVDRRSFPFGP